MPIATGVAKVLGFKQETTWGVAAGASAGQLLRRVSSNLGLKKDTYKSNEIRPDLQIYDMRHGARRVEGSIQGELSPGTYAQFLEASCRRDFTSLSASTSVGLTISGSGPTYTVVRGAGSWLTDGYKVGHVVAFTVGALNAANLNKYVMIVDIASATSMTVLPLNGVAMVAEGPVTGCTVTMIGKQTYIPLTGHTNDSFTIEHWFSDIAISHQYLGCRVNTANINLPATGMATTEFAFLGKDRVRGTSQYFTSATAATSSGVEAAVNGILLVSGSPVAILTALQFTANLNRSVGQVVGSNVTPDVFGGSDEITGQFSAYFLDDTYQAYLDNETEISMAVALTTGSAANADFNAFSWPRIKVSSADINDGQTGLIQQLNFQALLNSTGGAGVKTEKTTMQIQDSLA